MQAQAQSSTTCTSTATRTPGQSWLLPQPNGLELQGIAEATEKAVGALAGAESEEFCI
jgi:hypothetical protein